MASPIDAASAPAGSADKPLRRDAERNRQLVMQAARGLFAERGLAVSLDDIAERAGVGVGTVYRRFPSRDALVDALFEERLAELTDSAERALAVTDPWDSIVALLEGYLAIQAGDRSFGPVVMTDAHGRGGLDRARTQLKPIVERIMQRAQAAGVLRDDLAATDFPMIILMIGQAQNGARDVAPDVWRRYLTILLDGLRPGRETTTLLPAGPVDAQDVPQVMSEAFQPRAR